MIASQRAAAFTAASLPARYEQHLVPYLFQPWAEVLLDAVSVTPGSVVLDVASGTGVVARESARRAGASGRVLATDISPAMIEFNAAHPAEPGAAPIAHAVAPAEDLGQPDASFDLVVCQQGMPFFPDRAGAVREMHRVLRSGGVAGVAVWTPGHDVLPFGAMNQVLQDIGAPEPFPNAYDESSYALTPEQVTELMTAAGFGSVEAREVELVTRWPSVSAVVAGFAGTPFAALLETVGPAAKEEALSRMAQRLQPFVRDEAVAIPTYSVIARAVA